MTWRYIEDRRPVARKKHRCYLCDRIILAGDRYVKRFGVGEDGPDSFAMHEACESLTAEWDEDNWLYHDPAEFVYYELEPILGDWWS